jgi:intracellular multiplication protein IcmL
MKRFLRLSLVTIAVIATGWFFNTLANATPKNCNCHRSKLPPISSPNLYQVHVLNWAKDAAVLSFNYDYNNTNRWLEEYSTHFTPLGWMLYYKALKDSGNLERVKRDKITVSSVPLEPPAILSRSMEGLSYKWDIQIPVLVQFKSAAGTTQQKVLVTMTLKNTDPTKSTEDFAIVLFNAKPIIATTEPSKSAALPH